LKSFEAFTLLLLSRVPRRHRPSSLDAFVFGHLAPLLKAKLPNGKLQQQLKSLDNLTHFCSNILLLYFPGDGRGKQHDSGIVSGKKKGSSRTILGSGGFKSVATISSALYENTRYQSVAKYSEAGSVHVF